MAEGEEAMSQEDWKEKCMVLEALLMKFRVQIIKIRELTADKVGSSKRNSVNLFLTKSASLQHHFEEMEITHDAQRDALDKILVGL